MEWIQKKGKSQKEVYGATLWVVSKVIWPKGLHRRTKRGPKK
jgi:hypothetical protein